MDVQLAFFLVIVFAVIAILSLLALAIDRAGRERAWRRLAEERRCSWLSRRDECGAGTSGSRTAV